MLTKVKVFNCNLLHTSIYDHVNYKEHQKLLHFNPRTITKHTNTGSKTNILEKVEKLTVSFSTFLKKVEKLTVSFSTFFEFVIFLFCFTL